MTLHPSWLIPPQEFRHRFARKTKKVKIGDRVFPSTRSAAQILACSESHVRMMVYRKIAEYVE